MIFLITFCAVLALCGFITALLAASKIMWTLFKLFLLIFFLLVGVAFIPGVAPALILAFIIVTIIIKSNSDKVKSD